MAPRTPRGKASGDTSNPEFPVSTPSFGGTDNWSLQALVELKGSISRLEASIENLTEKVSESREDQRTHLQRIEKVERKILVASTVIGVLILVGSGVMTAAGFVANKAIDFGMKMAEQHIAAPATQQHPALPSKPTPPTQP